MSMTKRDFQIVANSLVDTFAVTDSEERVGVRFATLGLASRLAEAYPNFDKAKFIAWVEKHSGENFSPVVPEVPSLDSPDGAF